MRGGLAVAEGLDVLVWGASAHAQDDAALHDGLGQVTDAGERDRGEHAEGLCGHLGALADHPGVAGTATVTRVQDRP